jgi:flagellar protein FliO/FliZ
MKNSAKWIIVICLILVITSAVCAENEGKADDSSYAGGYDGFGDGIRMLASLLFVLALIVGGVFFLKKVPFYKRLVGGVKHPVSVLSNVSLGHKRSVCVVKVADEVLILGLTNTNISLLSKMNAQEYDSSENMVSEDTQNSKITGNDNGFLEQLKKAIHNRRFK